MVVAVQKERWIKVVLLHLLLMVLHLLLLVESCEGLDDVPSAMEAPLLYWVKKNPCGKAVAVEKDSKNVVRWQMVPGGGGYNGEW